MLCFRMILLSALLGIAAGQRLAAPLGYWNAALAAGAGHWLCRLSRSRGFGAFYEQLLDLA